MDKIDKSTSLWSDALRRLCRNRLALFGAVFLLLVVLLSVFAPWLTQYKYFEQDLVLGAIGPCREHWFGTDTLGRDLFTRVSYGGRISLLVGACATSVSLTIGVLWGTISGYFGGHIDRVMMRIVDIMYALPFTIFVILLMVCFDDVEVRWIDPQLFTLLLLFMAIGAVEWLTMARIVRGQVLTLKQQAFIEAAVTLGLSRRRIILRHLVPNVLGPIIVYTTLTIPSVMLLEAFLSFLGLGVQPPMSSWGLLINEGADAMEEYPWMLIFPGLFLSAALFALNFLGDGLRDALDPKSTRER
ncbi:MAG: ABC transporter permease subunit [Lentisphaeria bacterium]|jgi:oligopeptide transport system permease protein|nr:ABC transporter permease subunit [Lentisphaeria bacterium]